MIPRRDIHKTTGCLKKKRWHTLVMIRSLEQTTFVPSVKTTIGSSQTKLNISFDTKENKTMQDL